MLTGLQVWAGFAHKDVALAGDRPDGLRGWASVDLPALTAGQAEQGELAWVHSWSLLGTLRPGRSLLMKPYRTPSLTQSFMSCSVAAARRTGHLCRVLSGV